MNTATRLPARLRTLFAILLTVVMTTAGLSLGAAPALAATGDVTGATLQWGVKQSFRNYIAGPIAHGQWTLAGGVTDATPYAWTGGTGSASQSAATGSVAYPGSIHFQGHEAFGGLPAGSYALDLTLSNVRVVQASAGAATIVADIVSNSLADPTTFVTSANVAFATVDLAAATSASTTTTVAYTAAPATLTAAGAIAFAGFYAEGTALDPISFGWPVEQAPLPPVPTITVSKSSNISPAGEIVTVTGAGFNPVAPATNAARPPLAGRFGGAYVAFGKYAAVWKPSAGAASSTRKNGDTKWVVDAADLATVGGAPAGGVAINPDGTFSVQLLVKPGFTGEPATGTYGIYTYGGGSSNYAAFETYTPITFSTLPTIAVSKTTDLNPLGETVTVQGWNFGPVAPATNASRPPLAGRFGGAYVAFGKYAEVWKPSAGAASSARKNGDTKWVVDAADLATVGGAPAGGVAINPDGTFTTQLTITAGFTGVPATGTYGVYSYAGGSSNYAAFETFTPIAFTAATPTAVTLAVTPAAPVEGDVATLSAQVLPVAPGTVTFRSGSTVLATVAASASGGASATTPPLTPGAQEFSATFTPAAPLLFASSVGVARATVAAKVVGAGSLSWGIKASLRSYVTGPIAKGTITTTGASSSGGTFTFGQAGGGSYNAATGIGTSPYSGAVRLYGHAGLLDLTLANPVVRVDSATRATLLLSVNGSAPTEFASLDLAGATRTTPNNTVRFAGAPATLTAQGAAVFSLNGSAFYSAGESLDPVTFVVGSASATGGGSTTVASFTRQSTIPADTVPTTTGAEVAGDSGQLEEGGEVTITASGFEPNERGILVVIYSQPMVLSQDVAADASGAVSWTGRLPLGLTGEHTLTFQGSVDRGVVVTINPRLETTAIAGCAVENAELTWGFKESFRSYVSGSIANGEWTVANGASYEVPSFGWTDGVGGYDGETAEGEIAFTGSITFTGHGGVLNTVVANPVVRFDGENAATLLLDVTGTTQEGTPIEALGVEFASLDLAAATVTTENGAVSIVDAPATLLSAGAAAFGTYETGEALDPVTIGFDSPECAVAVEDEAAAPVDDVEPAATDTNWIVWLLVALLVIAVAVVAIVLLRRRKA